MPPRARRYVVTGASSGLGEALAREILRRGDEVWGVARRGAVLDALARELGGSRFHRSVCDVADPEAVRSACRAMREAGFIPDSVILNAGVNAPDAEEGFDARRFDSMVQVNLLGASTWVGEWLPEFLRRGEGAFTAVSSMAAIQGNPRSMGYAVSKRALSEFFRYLRARYGHAPVTFTTVHLGPIDTPMSRATTLLPGAMSAEAAARATLKATDRRRRAVYVPVWMLGVSWGARLAPDFLMRRVAGAAAGKRAEGRPPA